MIRDHTNRSGDVGPVVFDRLITCWWIIISGSVSERFPVPRSGPFDELRLFHIRLVDSDSFQPWRQQTGSGPRCSKRSEPTGPASAIKQSPKHHVRYTLNRSGKPLPVCRRHGGFCVESTTVASSSRNTASKIVQIVGIHYRDTVNMHMAVPNFRTSRKLSAVGEVN